MSDKNQQPQEVNFLETVKSVAKWIYSIIKPILIKIYLFIKRLVHREKIIFNSYQPFKKGSLDHTSEEYSNYQDAVFKNRFVGLTYSFLMLLYNRYLFPKENNSEYYSSDVFFQLATHPQNYVVMTKQEYQQTIEGEINKIIPQKVEEIRQSFIDQLLPFMSSEEAGGTSDFFAQKDSSRMHYYAQRKKMEELEERERKATHKEDKLELQQEKLEIQQIKLENDRKLFAVEMQNREIEHKIKMIELMNLSLDLQRKTNDIEAFKKQFDIMQAVHDLEMKERQSLVSYGQQMLQLKEQGLDNQLALKEAEFIRNQTKTDYLKMDIENKLLELRETSFVQKTKETLLDIEQRKLDVKKDKYSLMFKEMRLERKAEEQEFELMQERISIEKKSLQMAQEQENMMYKLQDAKLDKHYMSLENNRLMQELRNKPTYIDYTNK